MGQVAGQVASHAAAAASKLSAKDLGLRAREPLTTVRVVARFEAEDGVDQQQDLIFDVKPGATAGWLLSRVIERLHRERPEAPEVIGLKVLNAQPKSASQILLSNPNAVAAAACGALCAGEGLTARQEQALAKEGGCMPFVAALAASAMGDDTLVLDYSQPLEDALCDGDAFEAVLEVMEDARTAALQGRGPAGAGHRIEDFEIIRVVASADLAA